MCVSVFQKKFHNDGRLHFSHGHQSPYSVAMLAMAPTICWFSRACTFSLIVVVIIIIIIVVVVTKLCDLYKDSMWSSNKSNRIGFSFGEKIKWC